MNIVRPMALICSYEEGNLWIWKYSEVSILLENYVILFLYGTGPIWKTFISIVDTNGPVL